MVIPKSLKMVGKVDHVVLNGPSSGNVTEDLSLLGSMAYIDAEYTKGSTSTTDISGNTIYGVPDFTASLGLDYAVPVVDGLNVNARANYVSEQYLDSLNTYKLPDYTIL